MTNTSTIKVDINNPAPSSYEVYSHELNYGLTRFIEVEFFSYSQPLDFTNVTITATIVCDGYLVAEDIAVTSVTDNKVKMLISSTAQYTILNGLMYIEFKFKEGNTELYPPIPIVIDVKPSIRDNAQVTPESYGTVSEILQEVATARGDFNSLPARLDNIENDVDNILPISENDLDVFLQSFINSGYVLKNATVSTIAQLELLTYHINPCIYNLVLTGDCATAFGVTSGTRALMFTLGDWNVSVTRFLAIIGKQSEWTQAITISDSNYSYGDWIESSKGLTTSDLPSDFMDEFYSKIGYEEISIDDISEINSANFASPYFKYGLKLTGTAASFFSVDDNTIAELTTAEADGEIRRYIIFPEIEGVKWVQTVNSVAPSWSAGSWTKLGGNQVIKGNRSIAFNSDNSIKAVASVTGMAVGSDLGGAGVHSVYVAPNVTSISGSYKSFTPDLEVLYVDKLANEITIDDIIKNNPNITIYYKGEFSIIDLIIDSLMATVSVISQVNTQLESAINGVSE